MRRGMTLIELLIVCFILVIFIAIAAPLLRPNTEATKIREAARQVSAYFAIAQSIAAQSGRPAGIAFDRAAATNEQGRDSNLITRLYIVESPPTYAGDIEGALVSVWDEPGNPSIPGYTPQPINSNQSRLLVLDFDFPQAGTSLMIDVIIKSYFPNPQPGDAIPFSIKFGGNATSYPGLAMITANPPGIPGKAVQYFVIAQFGQPLYTSNKIQPRPTPYPPQTPYAGEFPFVVTFSPQPSTQSTLELPAGAVIDLQFSGLGVSGNQFFDTTRASTTPLTVVFTESGSVKTVRNFGLPEIPIGRMHFLLGSTARAIDAGQANPPAVAGSNLENPKAYWVTIGAANGTLATANNSPGQTIKAARGLAVTGDLKGGR